MNINIYEDTHPIGESIRSYGDTNSCTVVALSCVTGIDFESCDKYLRGFGRKYRRGMSLKDIRDAMKGFTKFKVVCSPYTTQERITINQFLKKHPKGKYYCISRGHAFAIIDGELYDHSEKLRRQIQHAWRFYNEDDLKLIGKTL